MLGIKAIIIIITVLIVLGALAFFFLYGVRQPIDERRVFSEGCIAYCDDIRREASAEGISLETAAVRKAKELEGSDFMKACFVLYPDTREHPYLCWNRGCCLFNLRPP